MAFSLSDLLNPAPASGAAAPPTTEVDSVNDPAMSASAPASDYPSLAPELFAGDGDGVDGHAVTDPALAAMAAEAATALELSNVAFAQGDPTATLSAPLLKHEDQEALDEQSQYPMEGLEAESATATGQDQYNHSHDDCQEADHSLFPTGHKEKKYKKRTDLIKDLPGRSTVHSSKNEGQHTDKRYLCYICNKLFTRRRSVRDHINKIHNIKTFEPQRSLEITVDPASGEPVEPLDDIIARGPPPPPPTAERTAGKKEAAVASTIEGDEGRLPTSTIEARAAADSGTVSGIDESPAPKSERYEDSDDQRAGSPASGSVGAVPRPMAGKKRPAPDAARPLPAASPAASATKKGIARPNARSTPSGKKTKLGHGDDRSLHARSPSATPAASTTRAPASKLKHQTNADSVASSPSTSRGGTVEPSSPTPSIAGTPASSNDDGEIFCICRKGDNHTWMIACDGGCDEWYHGNCVNIRERDGDLIDKYICPRCAKAGLQTTWKRMCRRKGCRKPARVLMDPPSKYCSKECGRIFFVELIRRGDPGVETTRDGQYVVDRAKPKKLKKKRNRQHALTLPKEDGAGAEEDKQQQQQQQQQQKRAAASRPPLAHVLTPDGATEIDSESRLATPAYSADEHSEYETDSSADEDELPNRGGPLRAGEVRAILDACPTIEHWRSLGRKPDTPPEEAVESASGNDANTASSASIEYDDFERAKLNELALQRKALQDKLEMLEAREKWMELIKARSASIVEAVKREDKKAKDACGFDPRFAWSEDAFLTWYNDKGGKAKLAADSVDVGSPEQDEVLIYGQQQQEPKLANGVTGDEGDSDEEAKFIKRDGVCVRNRCPRHKSWAKAQLAEIRFEQDVVRRGLSRCDSVERGVRERGIIRAWDKNMRLK